MLFGGHEAACQSKSIEDDTRVICMLVGNRQISIAGKVVRIAKLEDFEFVDDPNDFIDQLRKAVTKADIFTFTQKLPETDPKYNYYMEWDNVAALHITNFQDWWTKQLNQEARNKVRKAGKKGVEVQVVNFDDDLVRGITNIYNESRMRQGKQFVHYGKSVEIIKKEHATFLDRSCFLGAYYNDELIGFIKLVFDKDYARTMQVISKIGHRDKASTNALISKAVEVCERKKIPYLVYGKFFYGKKGKDSLSDFKQSNGFRKVDIPRYYVPITLKGKIALKLRFHQSISGLLPPKMIDLLIDMRIKWYSKKYSSEGG